MDLPDTDAKYTRMCSERTLQEEQKGFFQSLVDVFIENTDAETWMSELWNKNVLGIDFVAEFIKNKDIFSKSIEIFSVKPMYRKKNLEMSNKARTLGVKEMQSSNYQKALLLFNQAVILSPTPESNEFSINIPPLTSALWYRSECLMKMNKFQEALNDLHIAMKKSLPEEYRGALFHRQGECYKSLNDISRAKISFNLALKFLNENSALYTTTKKEVDSIQQKKVEENSIKTDKNNKNQSYDQAFQLIADEFIDISQADGMGRFTIAKKNLSIGDKILIEEPYAACLKFNSYGTNCYHCFKRLEVSYGCPDCANLAFCSSKCCEAALESYHKYECSFMDMFIGSGMSILCIIAMRMVTQSGLQKALQIYETHFQNRNNIETNNGHNLKICSDSEKEKLIYNLCTHTELREPMDYLKRFLMAFFLLRCLQKTYFFSDDMSGTENFERDLTQEEMKIVALLLHNIQMLQFNAHEIEEIQSTEQNKPNTKIKTRPIGIGIYPTVSLFNHDCYQGVARYFDGKKIILQMMKPVPKGAMIPENYGPTFTKRTKYARQRVLRSRYWFKCQCNSCVEIWPSFDQMVQNKSVKLRCSTHLCNGKIDKSSISCTECGTAIDVGYVQNKTEQITNRCICKYEEAEKLMEERKYGEATEILLKALENFHNIAHPPHFETHKAEQNLRTCFIATKNGL
ncbi:protein-lysine N-methyltransferase SMYD4-like isoform X2 [Arctopsyche grandis]|uniref:protein-lysine N-methyltransferase SMYD4-like isoform X2 n=1 Tax=Arctopsyche grandis TaxID=121162 RepID=UPI00406D6CBF